MKIKQKQAVCDSSSDIITCNCNFRSRNCERKKSSNYLLHCLLNRNLYFIIKIRIVLRLVDLLRCGFDSPSTLSSKMEPCPVSRKE